MREYALPPRLLAHLLPQTARTPATRSRGASGRLRPSPTGPDARLRSLHRYPDQRPARATRAAVASASPGRTRGPGGRARRPRSLRDLRAHPGPTLRCRHAGRSAVVVRLWDRSRTARPHRPPIAAAGTTTETASAATETRWLRRLSLPNTGPSAPPSPSRPLFADHWRWSSGLRPGRPAASSCRRHQAGAAPQPSSRAKGLASFG